MKIGISALSVMVVTFIAGAVLCPKASSANSTLIDEPTQVIHKFGGSSFDGSLSRSTMVVINGVMYGTTTNGGTDGVGSIFRITPLGNYQVVYSFPALPQGTGGELGPSPTNGSSPSGPLAAVGSVIYGTTQLGGFQNRGVLYSFDTTTKTFTLLHQFREHHADTATGAVTDGSYVVGTVEVGGEGTSSGVYYYNIATGTTKVKNFEDAFGKAMTFSPPVKWGLAFVGTTTTGGVNNGGTIYSFVPNTEEGTLTILHEFSGVGADANPLAVNVINDVLYGVTGSLMGNSGELFSVTMNTSSAVPNFSILHVFGVDPDASVPMSAPVMVNTPGGQKLIGLLSSGGAFGFGAVYTASLDGSNYSILHYFNGTDSGTSTNGLVTGEDGNLYGIGNPNTVLNTIPASIFRIGPQIASVNPMHVNLYNGGTDLTAQLIGSGFGTNVIAQMDGKTVSSSVITPGVVQVVVPSALITTGSHVFTLIDPNIGNTSNTVVMLANQVRIAATFGAMSNSGAFSQQVSLSNVGFGTAYNVHIVSAQVIYSNGSTVTLSVPSTTANLTGSASQTYTLTGPVISTGLSSVLVVKWAYSGGTGSAATRLAF